MLPLKHPPQSKPTRYVQTSNKIRTHLWCRSVVHKNNSQTKSPFSTRHCTCYQHSTSAYAQVPRGMRAQPATRYSPVWYCLDSGLLFFFGFCLASLPSPDDSSMCKRALAVPFRLSMPSLLLPKKTSKKVTHCHHSTDYLSNKLYKNKRTNYKLLSGHLIKP